MAKAPQRDKDPLLGGGSAGDIPEFSRRQIFDDLGSYGLRSFSGFVRDEFLPQLQGRQAQRVYREMLDNSSVVGAVMFSIHQAMRRVTWRVVAAGADKEGSQPSAEAEKAAEFVESLMRDMSHTWEDFIFEAISMLGYGFSVHEIVYKRRNGHRPHSRPGPKPVIDPASSDFSDGKIGWRRLPIRSQDTILKWFFDANGGIQGVTQQPYAGPTIDIPIEKALLFRAGVLKNNPEGRALDPQTPIPTPDGWLKLDDLAEGSKVFDETGRIRYVTARADWEARPSYRLTFSDGFSIVADANHEWLVQNQYERNKALDPKLRTTQDIAESIKTPAGVSNYSIAWADALDYPKQALLVDPYLLGMWLGDGNSRSAMITCHADDLDETRALVSACGYATEVKGNGAAGGLGRAIRFYGSKKWDSEGPTQKLRALGVLENKHIPDAYLRGSRTQRLALLSGLMDSDGHVDNCGRCEFSNVNTSLALGVAELVRSLGIGAALSNKINSHGSEAWLVKFTPTWVPFRLSRKAARCRTERQRTNHYIVAAEAVAPRRTVCIEVDSPSHLFLAGDGMVPTHNSVLRNAYRAYYFVKRLEELEAISVERMNGFPVISVPSQLISKALSGGTDPDSLAAAAAYAEYKRIASNIRVDEQMGMVMPSDVYASLIDGKPSAVKQYSLEFLTPNHAAKNDTDTIISRYKNDIMMTVLADFIQMGHEVRGTNNLAVTKVDMFYQAIEGWLDVIAAVLNRYALPRLWALNGDDPELMPEFKPDMAQRLDLDSLGGYVTALFGAGIALGDTDTQVFLREAGGMPAAEENVAEAADVQAQQAQDALDAQTDSAVTQIQAKPAAAGPTKAKPKAKAKA